MPSPRSWVRRLTAGVVALALSLPCIVYPQTDDPITAEARSLYDQGRAALKAKRPEAARLVLERSYELRPAPKVGFALGLAELDMGLFIQAATHMMLYMRQEPNPTPTERKAFAEAESNVAQLMFDVNIDRAHIFMDGENLGDSPFVFQPVYVIAGRHEIVATCEGFKDVRQTYDVVAGRRTDVKIVLERREPVSAPPRPSGTQADGGAPTIQPEGPRNVPTVSSNRLDARTMILGGGVVLTVAAGLFAAVEGVRASSATNELNDLRAAASSAGIAPYGCAGGTSEQCRALSSAIERHDDAIHLMRGAVLATAVLGGATVGAWLLWPRSKPTVQLTPQVGPSTTGLVLSGKFQ